MYLFKFYNLRWEEIKYKVNEYSKFDKVLDKALKGDDLAKVELVKMLKPLALSYYKKYCNISYYREDLIQDANAIIIECLDIYNPARGHFLGLVKSYIKYHFIKTFKFIKSKENKEIEVETEEYNLFDVIEDENANTVKEVLQSEDFNELCEACGSLTKRQLNIVYMYYFLKFSHKEIAEILKISPRTVENIKYVSIKKLKKSFRNVSL